MQQRRLQWRGIDENVFEDPDVRALANGAQRAAWLWCLLAASKSTEFGVLLHPTSGRPLTVRQIAAGAGVDLADAEAMLGDMAEAERVQYVVDEAEDDVQAIRIVDAEHYLFQKPAVNPTTARVRRWRAAQRAKRTGATPTPSVCNVAATFQQQGGGVSGTLPQQGGGLGGDSLPSPSDSQSPEEPKALNGGESGDDGVGEQTGDAKPRKRRMTAEERRARDREELKRTMPHVAEFVYFKAGYHPARRNIEPEEAGRAWKALFCAASPPEPLAVVQAGANYARLCVEEGRDGAKVKHMSTFLRGDRWRTYANGGPLFDVDGRRVRPEGDGHDGTGAGHAGGGAGAHRGAPLSPAARAAAETRGRATWVGDARPSEAEVAANLAEWGIGGAGGDAGGAAGGEGPGG